MDIQSLVIGVEQYTQQHLSHFLEELRDLCAIDSDSYNKPGLDRMANVLAERMRSIGMDATVVENKGWGNDLLGAIRGEGEGTVLLLGHMDTVYPMGTAAMRPVRVEGNVAYGPGVSDMKGCILSALYAIEAMLVVGYRSFGEIRLLCVSDEEINRRHCIELLRRACQNCDGALVLEAARTNGNIVSARKGNAYYTLTMRGRSAHAGVEPEKGRNAVVELAHQILQFESLNGWREGITINPGVVAGGTAPNVVPDSATARFDLRFSHTADRLAVEERWREMLKEQRVVGVEATLEIEPMFKNPMVSTPESMKLVHTAQDIAKVLGFSLQHTTTGGASDGAYATSFGVPTLDGLGPIGGRDHSPDEFLMVNSVAPRTALLAGLIASVTE